MKKRLVVHFSREVGDGMFSVARRCTYGDAEDAELHLALFKNHLFIYEDMKSWLDEEPRKPRKFSPVKVLPYTVYPRR